MLQEFKQFAMRGNVVDLAVGVIIGTAFGKIITSLVNDVIMPLIGVILGKIDFTTLSFSIGESMINYGLFIQSMVDFVIVAFCVFIAIKQLERFKKKEPETAAPLTKDQELLIEIRDLLKK